jgi:hypothetical protein
VIVLAASGCTDCLDFVESRARNTCRSWTCFYRFEFRLHAAHSVLNRLERNPQIRLHEQATEKVAPGTHGPPPVNAAYRTTTVEFLSYRPGLTRSAVACTALVHSWVAGQVPAPTT